MFLLQPISRHVHDKSQFDFKLGCLEEVCYNSLYFVSSFSTFSSPVSLDVTF